MQSFLDNTRTDGPCLYVIFKLISLYILSNLSTEEEIFAGLFLRIKIFSSSISCHSYSETMTDINVKLSANWIQYFTGGFSS